MYRIKFGTHISNKSYPTKTAANLIATQLRATFKDVAIEVVLYDLKVGNIIENVETKKRYKVIEINAEEITVVSVIDVVSKLTYDDLLDYKVV